MLFYLSRAQRKVSGKNNKHRKIYQKKLYAVPRFLQKFEGEGEKMIDEKKLIEMLETWQSRLKDSVEEEILSVFIKSMIDKVNAQPIIPEVKWMPMTEPPKKDETVLCVTDSDCYFVATYTKEFGFTTMDIGVDGHNIAWIPAPKYRPESHPGLSAPWKEAMLRTFLGGGRE